MERIYIDLCEPLRTSVLGKKYYFMLIVDSFSRKYFVKLLNNKTEVCDNLISIVERLENQTSQKLKITHTENGTEFENQ